MTGQCGCVSREDGVTLKVLSSICTQALHCILAEIEEVQEKMIGMEDYTFNET